MSVLVCYAAYVYRDRFCMCPTNERQHYIVKSSIICWAHTQKDPWYGVAVVNSLWPDDAVWVNIGWGYDIPVTLSMHTGNIEWYQYSLADIQAFSIQFLYHFRFSFKSNKDILWPDLFFLYICANVLIWVSNIAPKIMLLSHKKWVTPFSHFRDFKDWSDLEHENQQFELFRWMFVWVPRKQPCGCWSLG